MDWVAGIILIAVSEFLLFGMLVGYARGRYKVAAPAVSGHEMFERYFRVQQNTLEQLLIFIPAVWLFGMYVNARWAAILGAVFLLGRALYAAGYISDPKKRGVGFAMSIFPTMILLAGAVYGVGRSILAS